MIGHSLQRMEMGVCYRIPAPWVPRVPIKTRLNQNTSRYPDSVIRWLNPVLRIDSFLQASWKKSLYLKRVEPADSMWEACGMDDEEKAELLALPPWQCAITLKKQAPAPVNKRTPLTPPPPFYVCIFLFYEAVSVARCILQDLVKDCKRCAH